MPYDLEQAKQLHGIGSSSLRGMKRAAEYPTTSRPYDIKDGQPWTKNPTPISTASTRRPNLVPNPYTAALSSRGRDLAKPNGCNPTASKTITDIRPQKKQKTSRSGFEGHSGTTSKFFANQVNRREPSSNEPLVVPSTIQAGPSALRNGAEGSHPRHSQLSTRNNPVVPFSANPRTPSAEVITIDESESDIDLGTVVPRLTSTPENRDEIDFIDRPPDRPLQGSSRKPNNFKSSRDQGYGAIEQRTEGSLLRRAYPTTHTSSAFPTRARRGAEDGASTKRLDERIRAHRRHETPLPSSPLNSPPPLREHVVVDVDEVEEIEDADGFSDTPKPSSIKDRVVVQAHDHSLNRAPTPGTSAIKPGHVKHVADEIEGRGKQGSRFIEDLTKVGPRLRKSVICSMKKKNSSLSKRGKSSAGWTSVASRDKLATTQTCYSKQSLALPLAVCAWGSRKYQSNEKQLEPDFWLYWNEDAAELQLHKHPLVDLKAMNKRKAVHSIKLSLLKDCQLTISDDSDFHIARFEFDKDFDRSLPDDILQTGLTFKFVSQHTNMMNWEPLFSRMKDLTSESGRGIQHVIGTGSKACLEAALQSVDVLQTRPRNTRKESVDADRDASTGPAMVDESDVPAEKKRQPRPRPATGKNQGIAEMFSERPNRRSSRLSTEGPKEEIKQDKPPNNSDELILVYPPSGQGAVNITNADLRRLEPSEFLNDTLIELGLKFWLNDLRAQKPELAENIHVFSSFFFKKLASKNNKTPEGGHKSVRKWTAKVDIFKKKFIIVPINENIHWYLAIIYHPEHILEPALPKPVSRTSKRVSNAAAQKGSGSSRKDTAEAEVTVDTYRTGTGSRDRTAEAMTVTPATRGHDSEAEADIERELIDRAEGGVLQSLRSCSLDEHEITQQDLDEPPDEILLHSMWQTEDTPSVSVYQAEEHDRAETSVGVRLSRELEHLENSRMSTNRAVVEDSLSEHSDTTEIDQLDEDDVPMTSQTASSSTSTTPLYHSDMPEPSHFDPDDGVSLMDIDEPQGDGTVLLQGSGESVNAFSGRGYQVPHGGDDVVGSASKMQKEQSQTASAVPSASFYSPPSREIRTYRSGRRSLVSAGPNRSNQESEMDELDILADHDGGRESSEDLEVAERPGTIIFCMDSLGSSHPRALSRLGSYLQEEAKDKKDVQNPSSALTKKALVPVQPNFCDCGLYLLHFAQTFMTDPTKYKAAIFATKKTTAADRNELWHNEEVAAMRERMKDRILAESETWKKLKAEKEQNKAATGTNTTGQAPQVEQSDDEIEVSEVRRVSPSPKKQTRRTAQTPAARIR